MAITTSRLQAHEINARREALRRAEYAAWWERALSERERQAAFAAAHGGYRAKRGLRAA